MKSKKCITCGIRLHPTDWIILKEMNNLPICDNCSLKEKNKNELIQNNINNETVPRNKKIIKFPF
jgi:DNA-directed RNA polymerase subunit M/transcription elongation factor TFIIS